MKYIIDTNIFIQSKNFEYSFQYCKMFWDMLLECSKKGIVCSTKSVYKEIYKKNDQLSDWVTLELLPACPSFFEDCGQSMQSYAQIMQWANSSSLYTLPAKKEFATRTVADAFILAHALEHDYGIITAEKTSISKHKIKMPNVAAAFNIPTLTLFDFLRANAKENFTL